MTKDEKIFYLLFGLQSVLYGLASFYEFENSWLVKVSAIVSWLTAAYCGRLVLRRESDTYKNPNQK